MLRFTIVAALLLNCGAFYCYRRYQKRKMQSQVSNQVQQHVSQYFALRSTELSGEAGAI